jgi:pilus assembly protein FimV
MPLLFVIIFAVLVNFPSSVQAQESTTKIRGPRSSDVPAAPQTIGPLSPSDTLWRVAERIRPEPGISLYQVMYALYLKNPEAFLDNNLNHLRPGAVLILPSADEIKQIDLDLARQKSEQDDKDWAARQKAAKAVKSAAPKTEVEAVAADTSAAKLQAQLTQLGQQQRQELDGLRTQFADSLQQIEAIVDENLQLKTSLLKVEQELALIKAQLGDDAAMQQQIEQLLKQQAELLQAKAAEEAAAAAEAEQGDWQQWLKHPLAWILAACIPALLVLFSILLWVKKRGRDTEEVIHAAATEPVTDPSYHSPLPPLDSNDDLDESLFEIDDALLEDAFADSPSAAETAIDDDMLEFDDALSFEDDSLLPAETAAGSSSDALDEFDPDNILSDTDLSALLAAEDDDDAVVELADESADFAAFSAETPEVAAELAENDELADSLTAETEPALQQPDSDMPLPDEFDIDDLIEEIDLDDTESESQPVVPAPQLQEQQLTEALTAPEPNEAEAVPEIALDLDSDSFDSSMLEEFAESLVSEDAASHQQERDEPDEAETALLNAELTELLDQVAEQAEQAEQADTGASETDAAEAAIAETTAADDDILLVDDDVEDSAVDADSAALDLTASDDESVVRPTEASLSVENPSQILEQYPELELTEDDLISEATSELLDMPELDAELLLQDLEAEADASRGLDAASDNSRDDSSEAELDPLPDMQFDSLMSELEAMADNLDAAELQEQAELEPVLQLADEAETDIKSDITDDDFVEIDSLLANAQQQEEDSERFNQLNVDVGLDDYADIIGEHERRDVDREDNGYSAKLDLVRAYIEIDDHESAELLLDDILASDAPAHVKTEAQSLKQ